MGDGSPLFHSALDLLAHACEHYLCGKENEERDRKFVILHLANAVELLLKDRLLDLQISIYENPKNTKSITRVLNDLEKQNVIVPRKHIIELLIDERNTLQHRFGSPNSVMVKYYFDNCRLFFEEFMNAAFGLELREYLANLLDENTLSYLYPSSEVSRDILLQARQVARIHPSSAIMTAWIELEKKVNELRETMEKQGSRDKSWQSYPASPFLRHLLNDYMPKTDERENLRKEIVSLSARRNRVVHADIESSPDDADKYIAKVERILPKIEQLKVELVEQVKKESTLKRKKTVKK
jgi:hypothetical protein